MNKILKATHQGKLKIGESILPCAVLEDGTRVISQSSIFKAFGRTKRGRKKDEIRVLNMPSFIDAKNLQPFIDSELAGVLNLITYVDKNGKERKGYKAVIVPMLCEVYLKARENKKLTSQQEPLAIASEILIRTLSKVSIIALVDEATGYQYVRDKEELQRILKLYIREEFLPWTKRFPDEFYQQIFRLRGWQYKPPSVRRPILLGKITENIVYKRLPMGVLEELKRLNPRNDKGHRTKRHHQFLTIDIGNPHLEKHLVSIITLMRISPDWRKFKRYLERAFPIQNGQLSIGFPDMDDVRDDEI